MSNQAFPESFVADKSRGGNAPAKLFGSAVGVGYSKKDLSHTIFNHINKIMATIREVVGDDAVKAMQLFTWPS